MKYLTINKRVNKFFKKEREEMRNPTVSKTGAHGISVCGMEKIFAELN